MYGGSAWDTVRASHHDNSGSQLMSEALILEFNGVSIEQYKEVNVALGVDSTTGAGDWPAGLVSHIGATGPDGALVVVEVWDSQESQAAFMESRLGPALGKVGVPEPKRVEWLSIAGQHNT